MKVQLFRIFRAPDEEQVGFGLGNLLDPVNEYVPIGDQIFSSRDQALAYARQRGWQVARVED